jgi:hypothetical protein
MQTNMQRITPFLWFDNQCEVLFTLELQQPPLA